MHEHADPDTLPDSEERVERGEPLKRGADTQKLPLEALGVLLHVHVLYIY